MASGLTAANIPATVNSESCVAIDSTQIFFRARVCYNIESSTFESSYRANKKAIEHLRELLQKETSFDSIVVYSLSSPDGPAKYNTKLSNKRGIETKRILLETARKQNVTLNAEDIILHTRGENLEDLKRAVLEKYKGEYLDEIMRIIDLDISRREKILKIKNLNWDTWAFIRTEVIPELRSSVILFYKNRNNNITESNIAIANKAERTPLVATDTQAEYEAWQAEALSPAKSRPVSVLNTHQHLRFIYRVNKAEYDSTYMSNKENANKLHILLKNAQQIDSVSVFSFASPEGPLKNNEQLSQRRGEETRRVLTQIADNAGYPLDNENIFLKARGENWDDMKKIVEERYEGDNRDELLAIISSDLSADKKKAAIKRMGRTTWRFVIDEVMPVLRSSEIVLHYPYGVPTVATQSTYNNALPMGVTERCNEAIIASATDSTYLTTAERIRRTRLAVKTNMLYDAITWVNYSIEVPFEIKDEKFSVTYDHQFPWWRWGEHNNEYSNRYFQIGGEARWWFAPQKKARTKKNILRECLSGHFAGVYFMGGKYDFQWQRDICYQGEFWSAGFTYGYSMPISKLFNLEFSVSAGFAPITYRHYIPADDYSILFVDRSKMGTHNYIGLTKLSISLVMPLDFSYWVKNKKKK